MGFGGGGEVWEYTDIGMMNRKALTRPEWRSLTSFPMPCLSLSFFLSLFNFFLILLHTLLRTPPIYCLLFSVCATTHLPRSSWRDEGGETNENKTEIENEYMLSVPVWKRAFEVAFEQSYVGWLNGCLLHSPPTSFLSPVVERHTYVVTCVAMVLLELCNAQGRAGE